MTMVSAARLAAALLTVLALAAGAGATTSSAAGAMPTGLHGYLLRADEPPRDTFPRTPAFAWNPVPGTVEYEFQLSTSSTFRQNAMVFQAQHLQSPVAAPPLTLPWITGSPHALYARVRGVLNDGTTTDWSDSFGFDMAPPAPPTPLPGMPGLLRWSPVEGADGYEVWLVDAQKTETVYTNVLDERDFYTFHQSSQWIGTVRWRIRALRNDLKGRLNGVPITPYGKWSPIYSSTNPDITTGPIQLGSTVSDVVSNGGPTAPAHRLMPAFTWTGNQASDGTIAELYRVYVFTDKQCINRVFTSAIVGSPAYSPRPYGPLSLPVGSIASSRSVYIADGTEPTGYTYDGEKVTTSEDTSKKATPTTSLPADDSGSTGSTDSGSSSGASGSVDVGSSDFGATIDLWDTNWPQGGYYWTVIPVAAVSPGSLLTNVAPPGGPATATSLPVTQSDGFAAGDTVSVGNAGNTETAVITAVDKTSLTFASALKFNHGPGEPIVRTGGSLRYQDLEMAQDVCAAGRLGRFGKDSEPSLTSSGDLFASGLSPTGRLTSAVHTASFYRPPLVSWTPALGASVYELQWSKKPYPFDSKSGGKILLASTSYVLPLTSGMWYYRVRGYDYSLPTGSQQMSWSDVAKIKITAPQFTIVATGTSKTTKPAAKPKTTKPAGKKTAPSAAYKRWTTGNLSFEVPASWKQEAPGTSLFTAADPTKVKGFTNGIALMAVKPRNGRSFDQWAKDLTAEMEKLATVGAVKSTVVKEPAGTAIWLSAYVPSDQGPVNVSRFVFDGGSSGYALVLVGLQSLDSKYVRILGHAASTFKLG
ncbi:MAG: hypothetical protein E6G08_11110 [Actinobacteria bacterium]|nr:MAG: hypothetical protein E6G08_11110 [Actinomycetota bacterium]